MFTNSSIPDYDFLKGFMESDYSTLDTIRRNALLKENELTICKQRLGMLQRERDMAIERAKRLTEDAQLEFESQNGTSVVDIIQEFELSFLLGIAVRHILKAGDGQGQFDIELLRKAVMAVERHIENLEEVEDC